MNFQKNIALVIFIVYVAVILGGFIYFAPSWGLMDDISNQKISGFYWNGERSFSECLRGDMNNGRFRPLYYVWIIYAYAIQQPLVLYLLIALVNLGILLFWGRSIIRIFEIEKKDQYLVTLLYPLSFFIFTPFWNIFMYISLQEKFVYIFGSLSFYCFLKAYQRGRNYWIIVSILLVAIAVMGKETAITLLVAYCIYAFFDSLVFRRDQSISKIVLFVGSILCAGYFFFIKTVVGSYTQKYQENSNFTDLVENFLHAPFVIKAIFLAAILAIVLVSFAKMINKAEWIQESYMIIPTFIVAYLAILLPWGIYNYMLAPLAPFILVMFFPLFYGVYRHGPVMKTLSVLLLVLACIAILAYIIIPRIQKMANIKKAVKTVKQLHQNQPNAQFYFPPPYEESAKSMRYYTNTDFKYLSKGVLNGTIFENGGPDYLVYDDQAGQIMLKSVTIDKQVYQNETWKIFQVKENTGRDIIFRAEFPKNILQRIKNVVRQ